MLSYIFNGIFLLSMLLLTILGCFGYGGIFVKILLIVVAICIVGIIIVPDEFMSDMLSGSGDPLSTKPGSRAYTKWLEKTDRDIIFNFNVTVDVPEKKDSKASLPPPDKPKEPESPKAPEDYRPWLNSEE